MADRSPHDHGQEARGKSHDVPVDFSRIFYLLLRHWWMIALFVGVTMIATLGSLMTQKKIYASRAMLQVQQQEQNVLNVENVSEINPSSPDFINTVVETLTSNNLLLRVVEANKLAENPDFARPRDTPYSEIELANLMKRKVKVSSRRNTRLVDITVEDEDPVMARDIAASFVREFLRENFSQRMTVSRVATDFLQEEAGKLKTKLEESERKLQAYKQKNQAVSLDERQNIIVDQLKVGGRYRTGPGNRTRERRGGHADRQCGSHPASGGGPQSADGSRDRIGCP